MATVTVLFEVTIKEGHMDHYLAMAASLKEELAKAEGFLASERFQSLSQPNKLLSKSEWRDEESVRRWRTAAAHRVCQQAGREADFEDYRITVVTPLRTYTLTGRDEAPADSNSFFGV